MSRRTLLMTMAAVVLAGSIFIGASLACDTCPERGECKGTNTYCSGCDPYGTTTCSDFSYKVYGSGSVHDCKPDPAGASGLTCTDKTDVTCYHEADCVEGSWCYGFECRSGSCVEVWGPSWCQLCEMSNVNTVTKYDWTCE